MIIFQLFPLMVSLWIWSRSVQPVCSRRRMINRKVAVQEYVFLNLGQEALRPQLHYFSYAPHSERSSV